MANRLNNCFLINAPAGSGKTTEIKSMVQRCIIDNPKDNILCITYTNRAADELSKDVLSKNVFIGTIHSFLHSFLKPYFAHQNILELYFEIYGARISERIDNKGQKDIQYQYEGPANQETCFSRIRCVQELLSK